jgi:hypothetical protein
MAMSSSKHNNRVALEPRKRNFGRHPPVLVIPMTQLPVSTETKGEDNTALGQRSSKEPPTSHEANFPITKHCTVNQCRC